MPRTRPLTVRLEWLEDRSVPAAPPVSLGLPPGVSAYTPTAINDAGQVIGNSSSDGNSYLRSGGGYQLYPIYPQNYWVSTYVALNNSAVAVGDYRGNGSFPGLGATIALRYDGLPNPGIEGSTRVEAYPLLGGLVFGSPAGMALAVNDGGTAVGVATGYTYDSKLGTAVGDYQIRATMWPPRGQGPTYLNVPGASYATGINNAGDIVGYYSDGGASKPYFYRGGPTDLPLLPGDGEGKAVGINNRGDVIGTSGQHGVIWRVSPDTGAYAATSLDFAPAAINDTGVVVGGGRVWSQGTGMLDLNELLSQQVPNSGWTLSAVVDINSANTITGLGSHQGEGTVPYTWQVPLSAHKLDWNANRGLGSDPSKPQRGLDFEVHTGTGYSGPVDVSFYWAKGSTLTDRIGGPLNTMTVNLTQGETADKANEPAEWGGPPPAGADRILMVVNPGSTVPGIDPAANSKSIPVHTDFEILDGALGVLPDRFGTGIAASFVPGRTGASTRGQPLTLSEAEVVFGVDHFNWEQTVTPPENVLIETWRGGPAIGDDGQPLGGIRVDYPAPAHDPVVNRDGDDVYLTRVRLASGQQVYGIIGTPFMPDAHRPYLEDDPNDPYGWRVLSGIGGPLTFAEFTFGDKPSAWREEFLTPEAAYKMTTTLLGVTKDHQVVPLPQGSGVTGFTWEWNAYTTRNVTYFSGRPDDAPPVEGGGIFNVRLSDGTQVVSFPSDPLPLPPLPAVPVSPPPASPPPPPPPGSSLPVSPPPPASPPAVRTGASQFAVGAGGSALVRSFNPDGSERFTIPVFPGSTVGVRTAAADFTGDGVADVVAGTGPGRPTWVVILDGATQTELFAVDPFEASFTGGVYVAAGDLTGDGTADLVITPDEGGGPRVRVFSGASFGQIADFFGIDDPAFRGGARAAVGDINGDGRADLLVAAGFGGGPRLATFDGTTLTAAVRRKLFGDFFAFEMGLRNGVFPAVGDLDGDAKADVIAGGGPGGGPRVRGLSGAALTSSNTQTEVANFFGGDVNNRGGVRVAVKNLDGDARADLVVGAGTGAGSRVTGYLGKATPASGTPPEAFEFDAFPGFPGGVFVG